MDKEIEALKNLFDSNCENSHEDYDLIYHALRELKSIKEANPSEALRKLDTIRHLEIGFDKNGNAITLNDTSALKIIEKALTTKSKKEQAFDFLTKNFKVMVGVDKGKDLDFACLMFSAKDLKKVFWLAGVYKQQDLKTYNQLLELKEVLNDNSQE
jgi:hypothetical protein